jgi:chorismate dehydratase
MSLRIGTVPYYVGRPLDLGLDGEPGIELVKQVPAELISSLRTERLDVALVSTIEMFRQPGYSYLHGVGVCGRGVVSSVQVFSTKPILEARTVALDPASRTAATLVQILLGQENDGGPKYIEVPAPVDPRQAGADAWLRIGDPALLELQEKDLHAFDPCEEWTKRTGMPFIFAAWVVRSGADISDYRSAFVRARKRGAAAIPALARRAAADLGLPPAFCLKYLQDEITYNIGDQMGPALERFASAARNIGLASGYAVPAAIAIPGLDTNDPNAKST